MAATGSLAQRALIQLVRGYRLLLSPWLGASCRFEPTCSVYAIEALQRHGAAAGSYLPPHASCAATRFAKAAMMACLTIRQPCSPVSGARGLRPPDPLPILKPPHD